MGFFTSDDEFQHTAARRRLATPKISVFVAEMFQHTAARRRLDVANKTEFVSFLFQHTAARRRLGKLSGAVLMGTNVSTHSRPKAAGSGGVGFAGQGVGFNTQPPEGGWALYGGQNQRRYGRFNTQPPEGGWVTYRPTSNRRRKFQHTAARRRLAFRPATTSMRASFNTQPPEGGWTIFSGVMAYKHSFNTQPPEGGWPTHSPSYRDASVSTHSRPKAAG